MKKNKIIIIILAAILSISIITTCYFIADARRKQSLKTRKEEMHILYFKISPIVKLNFKERYYVCKNENDKKCDKHYYRVTSFELINEEAKKVYKDLDFKDKDLYQVILTLCDTAFDNKIDFKKVELLTDSDTLIDSNITSYLKNNSKNKITYMLHVDYQKHIVEEQVLKEETKENIEKISYLVTFDSYGGSPVEAQTIEAGQKAIKPANPTRTGYTFIEWRLNGKAYNFNSEITQNITLEAQWQKNKTSNKVDENLGNQGQEVINPSESPEASQQPQVSDEPTSEPTNPEPSSPNPSETPTVPEETTSPENSEGIA